MRLKYFSFPDDGILSCRAPDGLFVPYHLWMATQRISPPTLTSIEAITITQTRERPGNPPTTRTSRLTTTLTLFKPPPTRVGGSNSRAHSTRLPTSTIGAIVGSILGFIVLLVLVLYCCRPASSENSYSDSEGRTNTAGGLKLGRDAERRLQQARPSRQKRRPPMNQAHREPEDPNLPTATLVWLAGWVV